MFHLLNHYLPSSVVDVMGDTTETDNSKNLQRFIEC